ncbi:hypothetical protein C0Q70_03625 [Pomacea canaliculata]|uniref:Uncharacterized protein n=1 Tax=Pomacea canaliculata TaxID=400727 RepID=A0A2T7PTA1_POMCA|nr:hypothetical protein C0Q70_03625 [Pomacea canaliculata]
MKCLLVFAVICVVALAQRQPEEGGAIERLVADEVRALIRATPSITVADCTAKCDAVFGLDVAREEELTDRDCARECRE